MELGSGPNAFLVSYEALRGHLAIFGVNGSYLATENEIPIGRVYLVIYKSRNFRLTRYYIVACISHIVKGSQILLESSLPEVLNCAPCLQIRRVW